MLVSQRYFRVVFNDIVIIIVIIFPFQGREKANIFLYMYRHSVLSKSDNLIHKNLYIVRITFMKISGSVNQQTKPKENGLCCMFGNIQLIFQFWKKHAKSIFSSISFTLRSCLKQSLVVDHHATIVPTQFMLPELFSTFHYLSSSLAYLLSSLPLPPLFPPASDSQHGIRRLPSCIIACHVSTCHLSSFFTHFCSHLLHLEPRFFVCLNSACSLTFLHSFSSTAHELSIHNFILYVLLPSHPFICGVLPFCIHYDLNHSANVSTTCGQ